MVVGFILPWLRATGYWILITNSPSITSPFSPPRNREKWLDDAMTGKEALGSGKEALGSGKEPTV